LVLLHIARRPASFNALAVRQFNASFPARCRCDQPTGPLSIIGGSRRKVTATRASSRVSFRCTFEDNSQAFPAFFGEG
jgi:hypothetical protein